MTTRGRCLLAGGVAAVVCAVVLDERDLLRIGIFAALLPVVAWIVVSARRLRLAAEHQVGSATLHPGSIGTVTLSVTNVSALRSATMEISEPPTPDLTDGLRCLLPSLRSGRTARAQYRLHAVRRGRFTLGPPRVRISDPFGLWESTRTLDVVGDVLVLPLVVPLADSPASSGSRSAAADRALLGAIGGDPDVGVRPYRSGDDIRTVHWRASARSEDLMVRLEEPVSHGGATVYLDHRAAAHRGAGAASSLETAVTLAASVSLHLLSAEHQVRLITHTGRVLADGRVAADDVLAGLAVLEPDDGPARPVALGGTGLVIAVVGDIDEAAARTLSAQRRSGTRSIALALDTAAFAAAGTGASVPDTEPAGIDLLRTQGWRVVRIGPQDDLAQAWRRACDFWSTGSPAAQRRRQYARTPGAQ
ncbi:DUF58 domain-containing protein [Nakamurella flavida]|uniref:DUF58 domain-containing protein n=1 Tax=Nakamurella flavida TaxID=363630 RepID=A0A938YRZ1_9ACTN|nr:DUF58 domain-containing protein [Nakamurella flavida]MBM9478347.1 DUF58 domain-containing protein [Nakamurella flavida]MDP9777481.1 uncharacterized protein (DUF58 family) [Nakamurella flavida]